MAFGLDYGYNSRTMDERDFFDESETRKPANLCCLHCRQADTYEIRWLVRIKKKSLRGNADERDRAKFAKAQSYMLRRDDVMQCKNPRCRKRFEITGVQSVAYDIEAYAAYTKGHPADEPPQPRQENARPAVPGGGAAQRSPHFVPGRGRPGAPPFPSRNRGPGPGGR